MSQQLDRKPGPLVARESQSWLQQQAMVALPLPESHTASAGMASISPAPAPINRIATQVFHAMSKLLGTDAHHTTRLECAIRNLLSTKDIGTFTPGS